MYKNYMDRPIQNEEDYNKEYMIHPNTISIGWITIRRNIPNRFSCKMTPKVE